MRFTSVAYAPIVPRNVSLAPGTLAIRAADQAAGDRLGDAERPAARAQARRAPRAPSSRRRRRTRGRRGSRAARVSSASTSARAASSVSAFAVMRTTRPSMPRARNAIVGLPVASSASSRCATISASADSDVPHVFSERDTIAATLARAPQQIGDHLRAHHLLHLVRHAGHRVHDLAVAHRTAQAGRGAERVRQRLAALGHVGLAQVVLRHVAQARRGTSSRCARRAPCGARAARPSARRSRRG